MAIDWPKIKTALLDLADQIREAALDFFDDFKRQTKYFKARVGVIAGYVLLVALTLIIAPPAGESNPLDVRIEATSIPWGVGNKTIIELVNESGSDYEGLTVVVDGMDVNDDTKKRTPGSWSYSRRRLREGEQLQLEAKHFTDEQGLGPNLGFLPSSVEIRCSEGEFRKPDIKLRSLR